MKEIKYCICYVDRNSGNKYPPIKGELTMYSKRVNGEYTLIYAPFTKELEKETGDIPFPNVEFWIGSNEKVEWGDEYYSSFCSRIEKNNIVHNIFEPNSMCNPRIVRRATQDIIDKIISGELPDRGDITEFYLDYLKNKE